MASRLLWRKILTPRNLSPNVSRTITTGGDGLRNYDGPGKTTASFIDDEMGKFILVNNVTDRGFNLSNGAFAVGSIILFPSFIFKWKVSTLDDITPESLTLFNLVEPKIELLLIGTGSPGYWSTRSLKRFKDSLRSKDNNDLRIEAMPTRDAVATYNFMLADYRLVAGAFLPLPSEIEQKLLQSKR